MVLKCDECGCEEYLVVDGRHISEKQLFNLKYPPKSIKRYMQHELWCTSHEKHVV